MSTDVLITDWCPSSDMAQGLGSDGSDGDDKFRWNQIVADKLNDGNGNTISMTEAIQLLIQLRNSNA